MDHMGAEPEGGFVDTGNPELDDLINRAPSGSDIYAACMAVCTGLLQKNIKYGDSALNPVRVFSKADRHEQLAVRADDKLSRLIQGDDEEDEDPEGDLLGYLMLRKVARRQDST